MPTIAAVTIAVATSAAAWQQGDGADADDLAEHQLAGGERRQQHLDDTRRLLPGDAADDPTAVRLQQQEQGDVDEDGGARRGRRRPRRRRLVEALHRRRLVGHGRGDLLRRQPGLGQALGQGDVGAQDVDDGGEVGVVVGVDRLVDDDGRRVVEDGEVGVTGVDGGAGGGVVVDA